MAPHAEWITELQSHAHHPHTAQQMVCMGMGDEKVGNVFSTDACPLQLCEYAIATAGVNKQNARLAVERETGVVATGGQCIARAKHGDHVVLLLHVVCLY